MVQVTARHDMAPAELEDRLYAFNQQATGYTDGEDLGFVVEEAGELVGAVAGYTWGGICEVRQLWVREDRRKQGLGGALIEAAVEEARQRGAAYVQLSTYDFQAPAFYARHGFETVAELPDKPVGHKEFVMRRRLG
jgi:N-acetylglutamate synthase-like GNAT family acetyltransferase